MKTIVDGFFRLLKFLIAACLFGMVVMVFANVVLRYAFNTGITVSDELSRWLFVWMTFLGALVGMREYAHLGVDSVINRLPPGGKKICLALSQMLMLFCTWVVFKGSWQQTQINWDVSAPATGLSMGYFYGAGVVFSVPAACILLYDLFRLVSGRIADDELVMVRESEELIEIEHAKPHAGSTSARNGTEH